MIRRFFATVALGAAVVFGAGAAGAADIYLFNDPAVVDTSPGEEADNLRGILVANGHTVIGFSGATMATWAGALAAADVIVIPEQETGTFISYVDAAVQSAIQTHVSGGGSIQFVGSLGSNDIMAINTLFGYSLTNGLSYYAAQPATRNAAAAAGTPFAAGPTIRANNGSYTILTASLSGGALCVYAISTDCLLATLPYGSGRIVFSAYDYYNAAPAGTQDGGWVATQGHIISYLTAPPPVAAVVPTLTEWAMILFGLMLAGFAVVTLQRRRMHA